MEAKSADAGQLKPRDTLKRTVLRARGLEPAMNASFFSKNIPAISASKPQEASRARPDGIAVLVLPGFSHLALHAYLEPLHIANVVSRVEFYELEVVGIEGHPVRGANGLSVAVDTSLEKLLTRLENGAQLHQFVLISGEHVEQQLAPALAKGLRTIARRGIGMSAIGTAAWLFAQVGLLRESRCTIHWSKLAAFSEIFDQSEVLDALFVREGQITTCAGELAAFDLSVELIGSHAGQDVALEVCRYSTVEGQRSGSNRQACPAGLTFSCVSESTIAAMRAMEQHIEHPLTSLELSRRVGLSYRQLQRLFALHIGMTPGRYYLNLRLDHARRLVEGTRLPLVDIAIACGFVSASHFSKCFKSMHGVTPQELRLKIPGWIGPGIRGQS